MRGDGRCRTARNTEAGPVSLVFRGGLTGLGDLTGNTALNLRVVGLVLKDPISGQPVFVARRVEELN